MQIWVTRARKINSLRINGHLWRCPGCAGHENQHTEMIKKSHQGLPPAQYSVGRHHPPGRLPPAMSQVRPSKSASRSTELRVERQVLADCVEKLRF